MFPLSWFSPSPIVKSTPIPSLAEVLFLVAGILMLTMTLMETRLIPQASITQNDLMVAKIKAQKVVLAQDSLFDLDASQYKP
jgi:hypothetical protein